MEYEEFLKGYLVGEVLKCELLKLVPTWKLSRDLNKLGITKKTHIYIKNKGFIKRNNLEYWKGVYGEFLEGVSLTDLAKKLGLGRSTLARVFCTFNFEIVINKNHKKVLQEKIKGTCLEKYGVESYFQSEEICEKRKKTSLRRYGVEHPSQSIEVKKKSKRTCLEKYGVECSLLNKKVKEKGRQTNINKYGCEYPVSQLKELKDKVKKSNLQKFGCEYPSQSKEVRERMKITCLDRYGVDNYSKTDTYKLKIKELSLRKFGTEHPFQSLEVKEKIKQTNLERYGVEWATQALSVKMKRRKTIFEKYLPKLNLKLLENDYLLLNDYEGQEIKREDKFLGRVQYDIQHLTCGHIFKDDVFALPRCPVCFPLKGSYRSYLELVYEDFIKSLGIEVENNNRQEVLNSNTNRFYELDIFDPKNRIAFEINGLFYHSIHNKENICQKDKNYHYRKSLCALENNIDLYFIWDYFDKKLVRSFLISRYGLLKNKKDSRKLKVVELKDFYLKGFLKSNHLYGYSKTDFSFGLVEEDSLYSVIGFRLKDKETLEISRFCSKAFYNIRGGFSKLLKHGLSYIKENYKEIKKITTYCDCDLTPNYKNSVYHKQGFKFKGRTQPSLRYTDFRNVWSRQKFQKHKLKNLFPDIYNDDLTELEILSLKDIFPFYNSGNWRFEYVL